MRRENEWSTYFVFRTVLEAGSIDIDAVFGLNLVGSTISHHRFNSISARDSATEFMHHVMVLLPSKSWELMDLCRAYQ